MPVKVNNVMTVDVEDYFHVSAFENAISRNSWDKLEHRVERNTHFVLDMFKNHDVKATFFVLGWVAERYPKLIQRIVAEGHELASHGYGHQRLSQLTKEQIFADIRKSKNILEDISASKIYGYRAPSFSVNRKNIWVYDILKKLEFTYSSSIYPIKHDLYGEPNWPRKPFLTEQGILEIPCSTLKLMSKNIPIAGGGYYRLLPYWLNKIAINQFIQKEKTPYLFYFHPWEIDPEQPKIENIDVKSKIRHYTNLSAMAQKVTKLLPHYNWKSLQETYCFNSVEHLYEKVRLSDKC